MNGPTRRIIAAAIAALTAIPSVASTPPSPTASASQSQSLRRLSRELLPDELSSVAAALRRVIGQGPSAFTETCWTPWFPLATSDRSQSNVEIAFCFEPTASTEWMLSWAIRTSGTEPVKVYYALQLECATCAGEEEFTAELQPSTVYRTPFSRKATGVITATLRSTKEWATSATGTPRTSILSELASLTSEDASPKESSTVTGGVQESERSTVNDLLGVGTKRSSGADLLTEISTGQAPGTSQPARAAAPDLGGAYRPPSHERLAALEALEARDYQTAAAKFESSWRAHPDYAADGLAAGEAFAALGQIDRAASILNALRGTSNRSIASRASATGELVGTEIEERDRLARLERERIEAERAEQERRIRAEEARREAARQAQLAAEREQNRRDNVRLFGALLGGLAAGVGAHYSGSGDAGLAAAQTIVTTLQATEPGAAATSSNTFTGGSGSVDPITAASINNLKKLQALATDPAVKQSIQSSINRMEATGRLFASASAGGSSSPPTFTVEDASSPYGIPCTTCPSKCQSLQNECATDPLSQSVCYQAARCVYQCLYDGNGCGSDPAELKSAIDQLTTQIDALKSTHLVPMFAPLAAGSEYDPYKKVAPTPPPPQKKKADDCGGHRPCASSAQ